VTDHDIDDLIGEFVVEGYRFKVVTSHVVVEDPDRISIIRVGGIFPTDFFVTVSYPTYATLKEKGFIDTFLEMLQTVVPEYLENLDAGK